MYSGITAEHNRLIRDDVQEIAVGTTGLAPNAVVVSPGATIRIVGALLSTRPAGDDQIVNRTIVAGANGIAETTANNEVGTAQYGLAISSAYRNPQRNRDVRSKYVNSYHVQGKALDLVIGAVPGKTSSELYCILEQAGINQGYYSLSEDGAAPRQCDDSTVDHVHFDNR